jgi:2-haloacid dehalogenase
MSITNPPQALFFDIFGTVVDWRSSITHALQKAAHDALHRLNTSNVSRTIPPEVRSKAAAMTSTDWHTLAHEWRQSYKTFTRSYNPETMGTFILVDEHHHAALPGILESHGLSGLWTSSELETLALAWHHLNPWPDTVRGLTLLGGKFTTITLSNGNIALLNELCGFAALSFREIVSAEDFGAYKPNPKVYLGAARKLGLEPAHCAMVAAHLSDLKAAKGCGFQTIYVEREDEEDWDRESVDEAKKEGWVDMWVVNDRNKGKVDQSGFVEVARRFGV